MRLRTPSLRQAVRCDPTLAVGTSARNVTAGVGVKAASLVKIGLATVAASVGLRLAPMNVMISVTNRCQSRCAYCSIPSRRQREMSTEEILRLFDELRAEGTQRIALWGGEPLLREDIGELVDYAKRTCGFHVSLDTNGLLVPEKIDLLRNLDVLVVSYDGTPGAHERNREPGSHDAVSEALRVASRVHRVFSITVLTVESIGQIDAILETARAIGFSTTFQLLHLTRNLGSEEERALLPDEAATRAAIRLLIERKRQGAPIVSSFAYLEHLLGWADYRRCQSAEPKGPRCHAGRLFCNVDTDGSVYPCSRMIDRMPARNFLDGGFRQAFAAMGETGCRSCIASSLVEYNFVHSMNAGVIWNWLKHT